MPPKSISIVAGVLIGLLFTILSARFYVTVFGSSSPKAHDESISKSVLIKSKVIFSNIGNDKKSKLNSKTSSNMHGNITAINQQHRISNSTNPKSYIADLVVPIQSITAQSVAADDSTKNKMQIEEVLKHPIARGQSISLNDDIVLRKVAMKTEMTPNIKFDGVCPYTFKVFVYPLPSDLPSVRISEEARRNHTLHVCSKCILEQFSLEYIMNDFFHHFCGRTYDPEKADYFYLPLVRDAEYRLFMHKRGGRDPSTSERAILNVLEKNDFSEWYRLFNYTDRYWRRRSGYDHIFVMPAPVTNFRHEGSRRGFFHYMPHLHAPIFINIEYSLSFVKEYPVCSSQKNIVVPYPTIDPKLYNGFYLSEYLEFDKMFTNISDTNKYVQSNIMRPALMFYSGGMHGECVLIREAIRQIMMNASVVQGQRMRGKRKVRNAHHIHDAYFDNPVYHQYHINIIPPLRLAQHEHREMSFLSSIFCPIPVGDSPSSKRMYDVMNYGCIPVILSDDLVWALSAQTGGYLDPTRFAIQLPQCTVQYTIDVLLIRYKKHPHVFGYLPYTNTSIYNLLKSVYLQSQFASSNYVGSFYLNPLLLILLNVPAEDILYMQKQVKEAAHYYRYYNLDRTMKKVPIASYRQPDGGAVDLLARSLEDRKVKGIQGIGEQCQAERNRKGHHYIGSYPCERPK